MGRIDAVELNDMEENQFLPNKEYGEHIPNAETLAALEEVERMRLSPNIGKGYTDLDELFADLRKD